MSEADRDLRRMIEAMRAPVEVRPAWRDALLREIAAAPPPELEAEASTMSGRRGVWSVRPALALAASIVLFCGGIWVGIALARRGAMVSDPARTLAALPSAESSSLVTVRFLIVAREARRVSLVGDFNRWNPGATPMRRGNDGQSWIVEVPLAPGRHVYAFVVDGDVITDPAAPTSAEDDFGVPNSVVLVAAGGT